MVTNAWQKCPKHKVVFQTNNPKPENIQMYKMLTIEKQQILTLEMLEASKFSIISRKIIAH